MNINHSRLGVAMMAANALLWLAEPCGAVDPEVIYRAAVDDMKAGRFTDACPKFAEARRLKTDSTPALQGLAQCYDKIGKTASAWAKYRELSVEFKSRGDASLSEAASGRADEISKSLSTLLIKPESPDTAGLVIQLDKEEVPKAMFGTKMNVDPGQHILQATAPGYEVWQTTVTVGQKSDVKELKVPALIAKPLPPPDKITQAGAAGPNPALRPAAFAVGGVGAAGLIVGGVFGGLALSAKSTLTTDCPNNVCTSQAGKDARASAGTKALVSTIGLGVGGAALATGVVLFIVSTRGGGAPKSDDKPSVQPKLSFIPSAGPDGGGLNLVGSF